MGVKLQSSSGGSVEIAAPVTASNYTLTAPTTSSTIDTLARAGNVLQVVNAMYSTTVATTLAGPVSTGLSATITPSSVSSKILVLVDQNVQMTHNADGNLGFQLLLYRNGSTLINPSSINDDVWDAYINGLTVTNNNMRLSVSRNFLDSPATTAATTYSISMYRYSPWTGTTMTAQYNGKPATITLMEIAG